MTREHDWLFEPVNGSNRKVRCRVCGKSGYDVGEKHPSWKAAHIRGHGPCPKCGKPLSLKLNGFPRRHGRCPSVPITPRGIA